MINVRDIFPGGNTPYGFFSYYDQILDQNDAERIICIKGGPGVGKSTLMKNIAEYYTKQGEKLDMFWCSADPDSLDGVLLKDRNISIVDGTAPHVIDPYNPGAVDEIIDLAVYLDKESLRKDKSSIIECNRSISKRYDTAYTYLKRAKAVYDHMNKLLSNVDDEKEELLYDISAAIKKIDNSNGKRKKYFAEAITSKGVISFINSIASDIDDVYILRTPIGAVGYGDMLRQVSRVLQNSGYDTEEYYCPMDPVNKIEHVISKDANMAILTVYDNSADMIINEYEADVYSKMVEESRRDISKAIEEFKKAKELHDRLESYYIKNMDFDMVEKVKREIIAQIG